MPVAINDRPRQAVRDEVIDQLIMNYSHGKLSYEAFERRLDIAMESENNEEIAQQAEDLDMVVDPEYIETKKSNFGYQYKPGAASNNEAERIVNVFSGSTLSGIWQVPSQLKVLSVFSGSDLDFSEAVFTQPVVEIKIFSLFSGDNIYVPENVNVVSKAFCIFGGIDNKTMTVQKSQAPTLVIEGFAIFSGIDIKIKQTIKERFVAFADNLKSVFKTH